MAWSSSQKRRLVWESDFHRRGERYRFDRCPRLRGEIIGNVLQDRRRDRTDCKVGIQFGCRAVQPAAVYNTHTFCGLADLLDNASVADKMTNPLPESARDRVHTTYRLK